MNPYTMMEPVKLDSTLEELFKYANSSPKLYFSSLSLPPFIPLSFGVVYGVLLLSG